MYHIGHFGSMGIRDSASKRKHSITFKEKCCSQIWHCIISQIQDKIDAYVYIFFVTLLYIYLYIYNIIFFFIFVWDTVQNTLKCVNNQELCVVYHYNRIHLVEWEQNGKETQHKCSLFVFLLKKIKSLNKEDH